MHYRKKIYIKAKARKHFVQLFKIQLKDNLRFIVHCGKTQALCCRAM